MPFTNAKIVARSVNPLEYHAANDKRGTAEFSVSYSSLVNFLRCPQRWLRGYESPDTKAKQWGNLVDAVALTPTQFSSRYSIRPATYKWFGMKCPSCGSISDSFKCRKCGTNRVEVEIESPWEPKAKECKAWVEEQGVKEIVPPKLWDQVHDAVVRLHDDELIKRWSDACDKQVWVAGEWKDEKTGLVVPCRCLIDFVPKVESEFSKCLGDLKAVRNAAPLAFQRQVFQYGWHIQAAFDLDLFIAATGEDRSDWCFIVQENYEPWEPAHRLLSQDFLAMGRQTYAHALSRYARCLETGEWPGYDSHPDAVQGWTVVSPEAFMQYEAISNAMMEDQDQDNQEDSDTNEGIIP